MTIALPIGDGGIVCADSGGSNPIPVVMNGCST